MVDLPVNTRVDRPGPADARRVPELDALRGLAALAVVVFHATPRVLPFGWAAVDLFFVLSGYLITSIILRHGATPGFLGRFYLRRGLRVWPIYYLAVGAFCLAGPWLPRHHDWAGLPATLTFTQALPHYWGGHSPAFSSYLGHLWTLAVEEQFYLLWPAALVWLGLGRGKAAALAAACVVASASARGAGMNLSILGGRGDGLALGGLLAAILADEGLVARRPAWLSGAFVVTSAAALATLVGLAATVGLTDRTLHPHRPGLTILAFGLLFFGWVGLTVCHSGRPWLAPLRSRTLRRLGELSYGLYLYHLPVLMLSTDLARAFGKGGQPLWRVALSLAVCLAVAGLSWRFIEAPILRLKDRFPYLGGSTPSRRHTPPTRAATPAERTRP